MLRTAATNSSKSLGFFALFFFVSLDLPQPVTHLSALGGLDLSALDVVNVDFTRFTTRLAQLLFHYRIRLD